MLYQKASVDLLENKDKEDGNLIEGEDKVKDKFEDNLGIGDENKTIWINYINNYDLDDDLKNYSKLIELQSQQVIENSTDYDKYVGILSN